MKRANSPSSASCSEQSKNANNHESTLDHHHLHTPLTPLITMEEGKPNHPVTKIPHTKFLLLPCVVFVLWTASILHLREQNHSMEVSRLSLEMACKTLTEELNDVKHQLEVEKALTKERQEAKLKEETVFEDVKYLGAELKALTKQYELFIADLKNIKGEHAPSSLSTKYLSNSLTTKTTNDFFDVDHEIHWSLPPTLAKARHKECAGGAKISKTGGFCLTKAKHMGGNYMYDSSLASYFAVHVFNRSSVVDLGAGLGHYAQLLLEHPTHPVKAWAGYDGSINVQEVTNGLVRFMDLTQPDPQDERPCGGRADWVLSLEVGEHIPKEKEDSYLRNIRCRARLGAVISWALPHQRGGLGHVNMLDEATAIPKIERWGFKIDWDLTKGARQAAKFSHFKNSTYVFRLG